MNIFRLHYYWYEGEHDYVLLGKTVERAQFEKDLLTAKDFAKSLLGKKSTELGKGYSVECLPAYYKQIIWYLTEKLEYTQCEMNTYTDYIVDDDPPLGKNISITRTERKKEQSILH
jgi:hypothetical protein